MFDHQIKLVSRSLGIPTYFQTVSSLVGEIPSLIHHTFYLPWYPSTWSKRPRVVTIFDFIPETQKSFRARRAHLAKNSYIKRSHGVIFISETVKNQAFELGYCPKIWEVTPLASRFTNGSARNKPQTPPTVLYVGARSGYKNFNVLPSALAISKTRPKLVIVGGGKLSRKEKKSLLEARVSYEHVPFASESELRTLYETSSLCVITSLQEGFGLPLIEAMSLGCPVAALDTEINREVGGDAFLVVEDSTPNALAKAIDDALSDGEFWKRLSLEGIERSRNFSWETTAQLTANLYQRVLEDWGQNKLEKSNNRLRRSGRSNT